MTLDADNIDVARGQARVLHRVSLSIRPGSVVGLLGANGAGKSTLLAALAGELRPDAGRILLDGEDARGVPARRQARRRAVLPQKPSLTFDLGVRDVVSMGAYPFPELSADTVDALIDGALDQAGVAHLADRRYPELSGGEQQRVQFARVLTQCRAAARDGAPPYLLLDEPISSLDPKHQIELLRTTWTLAHQDGLGVLVIVHDINLAACWCDRLVLLADGAVAAEGVPSTVLTPALLRAVYDLDADVLPHPRQAGKLLVLTRE
ncbi:heme ABC transporter ATP-binding protein [Achromobacter aloeverae]|uniref:Heme ABC transporter ATP-binding protein n=1 Tax=Achromobacter aloeverae TaxID=1750518 RepID=A0A4Q1HGL4_9BURK|nr:heme ABC transporter ATP-binding protein [Achromobacter aloeverae]RXN85334.1 heme ABC transporter ATP-binding protein [Achromobacter aloeverae]